MLTIILFLIILLLVSRWMVLFCVAPFLFAYARYQQNHNWACKIFASPYALLNRATRGGFILYMSYFIGKIPSHHIRDFFYKVMGISMGTGTTFHIGVQVRSPWNLKIGDGSIVGDSAVLDARSGLMIGRNVNISSNVSIWTLQHDYKDPDFACATERMGNMAVNIGDRVWLGCNVVVLPGVSIGEGAVCCAGCVVTKDVPPFTVVAGIPAKPIGKRPEDIRYEFNGKCCRLY